MEKSKKFDTPFNKYFKELEEIHGTEDNDEYGSILIISMVEELGEMARAYLAKQGRKPTNLAAQNDEKYEEELGDLLVAILNFARIKGIDLDERIEYTIEKVRRRRKVAKK